ncbi:MAG TPA: YdcF family protein [Terracidiphilus sp.]|nr:YdcF family protein [Terracidiphilus sp.]
MERPQISKRRRRLVRGTLLLLLALTIALAAWFRWVYVQIERYATLDQAAPADAIAVFGAAEYDGKPSPVFRARLDHARSLYNRGIAPILITMGGNGGDQYTEGAVGREYLMGTGVPEDAIIAETHSTSSEESARRIAVIARANRMQRLLIVSDPTHMFRIHEICAADGLNVLTSPRPRSAGEDESQDASRVWHEIFAYTLWKMHLH